MKHFILIFLGIGIVNQSMYNFCMKSYCLAAAFPRVFILTCVLIFTIRIIKGKNDG